MVRAIVILCPRRENPTSISFFGESERWKYLQRLIRGFRRRRKSRAEQEILKKQVGTSKRNRTKSE